MVSGILTLILAIIIVNFFQKVLMSITGTSVMFYSMKSKLVWYGIVWVVIYGLISGL